MHNMVPETLDKPKFYKIADQNSSKVSSLEKTEELLETAGDKKT